MKLSLRFSRIVVGAPDTSKIEVLYQPSAHISRQSDSMGITVAVTRNVVRLLKRKENSSQGLRRCLEVQLRYRTVYPYVLAQEY